MIIYYIEAEDSWGYSHTVAAYKDKESADKKCKHLNKYYSNDLDEVEHLQRDDNKIRYYVMETQLLEE